MYWVEQHNSQVNTHSSNLPVRLTNNFPRNINIRNFPPNSVPMNIPNTSNIVFQATGPNRLNGQNAQNAQNFTNFFEPVNIGCSLDVLRRHTKIEVLTPELIQTLNNNQDN